MIRFVFKRSRHGTASKEERQRGANLGFEAKLWAAADKLRGNTEPSDYKHVALGLIFLKYISDAFEAKREHLLRDAADPTSLDDVKDESARYHLSDEDIAKIADTYHA